MLLNYFLGSKFHQTFRKIMFMIFRFVPRLENPLYYPQSMVTPTYSGYPYYSGAFVRHRVPEEVPTSIYDYNDAVPVRHFTILLLYYNKSSYKRPG